MINSFEPISSKNSEILILGTIPGEVSLRNKEYYGHKNNLFWDILFRVIDDHWNCKIIVEVDYNTKINLLLDNNIALWDVLDCCERNGSLDTQIKNEFKNDFKLFFTNHPNIKTIFFNGKKASDYFLSITNMLPEFKSYNQIVLQSTSPRNTTNTFYILYEW